MTKHYFDESVKALIYEHLTRFGRLDYSDIELSDLYTGMSKNEEIDIISQRLFNEDLRVFVNTFSPNLLVKEAEKSLSINNNIIDNETFELDSFEVEDKEALSTPDVFCLSKESELVTSIGAILKRAACADLNDLVFLLSNMDEDTRITVTLNTDKSIMSVNL